jgi:hypothetical protein
VTGNFPRGTVLQVDSLNTKGPKRICLKTADGKRYNFAPKDVGHFDIKSAAECDINAPWERGILHL